MPAPSLKEALQVYGRIGLMSFGGPAAQIAVMHKELVEDRTWLTEQQYLNALSFCMLLPGPEAMQLATYSGWRTHGTVGGVLAGLLFVLPGAIVVLILSLLYALYGDVPAIEALFLGIKSTVVIVVIEALLKVSKKALHGTAHWAIAGLSFAGIFFFQIPFPLIILIAGAYGFKTSKTKSTPAQQVSKGNLPRTVAIWLTLWWAPIMALWVSGQAFLTQIAMFFSKLAVVTFGGAYAVLAYMTQAVVVENNWLSTAQMMDGLGLAETTPGPLILVTEFVGFQAGFAQGGIGLAISAAVVTLWVTFIPCFLWIFAGAPYLEWITSRPTLRSALQAITAAVVGVILNLSLWFALHVYFSDVATQSLGSWSTFAMPILTSVNLAAMGLSCLAGYLILVRKLGLLTVLSLMAIAGLGLTIFV
ncbi:MAG: chromate efflux transporter [Pseudoruegeria sp.]